MKPVLALLLTLALLPGCGGDGLPEGGGGGKTSDGGSRAAPPATPSGGARACPGPVTVPGHEGVDVRVEGADCARAEEVIAGAVGRGRRAYEVTGFSCRPSPAGGGDTNYACTGRGGARISFRYGAA